MIMKYTVVEFLTRADPISDQPQLEDATVANTAV